MPLLSPAGEQKGSGIQIKLGLFHPQAFCIRTLSTKQPNSNACLSMNVPWYAPARWRGTKKPPAAVCIKKILRMSENPDFDCSAPKRYKPGKLAAPPCTKSDKTMETLSTSCSIGKTNNINKSVTNPRIYKGRGWEGPCPIETYPTATLHHQFYIYRNSSAFII